MTAYDRPELCCDHVTEWMGKPTTCSAVYTDQHAVVFDGLRALSRQHGWTTVFSVSDAPRDYCPRHAP